MKIELSILSAVLYVAARTCMPPSPLTLQLILEYSNWRSWKQIVLFDNLDSMQCSHSYVRPFMACLAEEGISVSIQSASNPNIPDSLKIQRHRIGSIVLLDRVNLTSSENVLQMASQKLLFNYYISWVLVTTKYTDNTIDAILRDLNIGIDSDVVVATFSKSKSESRNLMHKYWSRMCPAFQTYGSNMESQDISENRNASKMTNLDYVIKENRTVCFYFVHVYKIRNSDNSSLVVHSLGSWSPGFPILRDPISVKLRNDFNGLSIIFGVLNGTNDGQTDVIDEVEANDIAPLLDFATFVTHSLNASMELVPHEKLGTFTNKIWTNLLGDVVAGTVDIGLGYITISDERLPEMAFSHPLIRYMRNVYYHPLETGTMRDIFLQPFNDRLLGCVTTTYFFIFIAMVLIIYTAKTVLHHKEERNVGLGEAALWCMSIMCMQGSPWIPKSPSGKTVLLFSLIFALVTYNAYAGFITSILSVQASGIKSITDLLLNNFKVGYSVTDDEYIRNVNDSNLRQLYIKAFNNRESRLDTTSGLMKAVQGRYGFFVSATLARRALRTTLIQERCSLKELTLPQTFTLVALPMANTCPYKKIINLSILRIQERGVLRRISEKMLPSMPRCKDLTTFNSARLADVYSAFLILIVGLVISVSIGIFERIWNKRRQMQESIVRGIREHHLHLPHLHLYHHHHHHHHHQQQQQHQHQQQPSNIYYCNQNLEDHRHHDNGLESKQLSNVKSGYSVVVANFQKEDRAIKTDTIFDDTDDRSHKNLKLSPRKGDPISKKVSIISSVDNANEKSDSTKNTLNFPFHD